MARKTSAAQVKSDLDAHNSRLAKALEDHDRLDTERFSALQGTLDEIRGDVKSLLQSRSFMRGAVKTIVTAAGSGGAVTFLFEVYKRFHQ